MADTVSTNQFKNGMHIEIDGGVWRIVEFQHVKPGKGGAFVRTRLKNLETGAVVDDTFRAGEKFPRVHTEVKSVQFLYDDGTEAHFMDEETYEQFGLPRASLERNVQRFAHCPGVSNKKARALSSTGPLANLNPAASYSSIRRPYSTIGAGGLNGRVRDGIGCDTSAIATGNFRDILSQLNTGTTNYC